MDSVGTATDATDLRIWGGAGITGVYLIQLAKLLGYRVICAASPVNEEYVTSLGADVVLDRWKKPEELVEAIREATKDQVSNFVDCLTVGVIGGGQRRQANCRSLRPSLARLSGLEERQESRDGRAERKSPSRFGRLTLTLRDGRRRSGRHPPPHQLQHDILRPSRVLSTIAGPIQ